MPLPLSPNRGAWLEYESDSSNVISVRIDKNRKLPITTFVRALGALTRKTNTALSAE